MGTGHVLRLREPTETLYGCRFGIVSLAVWDWSRNPVSGRVFWSHLIYISSGAPTVFRTVVRRKSEVRVTETYNIYYTSKGAIVYP